MLQRRCGTHRRQSNRRRGGVPSMNSSSRHLAHRLPERPQSSLRLRAVIGMTYLACPTPGSYPACRAQRREAAGQGVGVDHGRGHVLAPRKLLDGADVTASFEQVGVEGMAGRPLRDARRQHGPAHG